MSPQSNASLVLPVIARCNVTGEMHTIPTAYPQLPLTGRAVVPDGEIIANCPTGDGTAISVGQAFYFVNGEVTYTETFEALHNKWTIYFESCIVDSQELGSNNEYMYSAINFKARRGDEFNPSLIRDFSCTVRQSYGGDFSFDTTPLTVMPPIELQGLINFEQFSRGVEMYYRQLVGSQGNMVRVSPSVRGTRMHNMRLYSQLELIIDAIVPPANNAWGNND
jgi:hypothetical protein